MNTHTNNEILRAFCNITGAKPVKPSSKLVLPTISSHTSKWTQIRDLKILNLPPRADISEVDVETCMFGNFVRPEDFDVSVVNAIGDLDIDSELLEYQPIDLIEGITASNTSFKDSLLSCVANTQIKRLRREGLNIFLLQRLMEVSGLVPGNGFLATFGKIHCNHLELSFGEARIHCILDWAIWLESIFFRRSPYLVQVRKRDNLILHATEVKLDPSQFEYAQLVGQNLLQANYNREMLMDANGVVTSYSMAVSGWMVRFMTFQCSDLYLDALKQGKVLQGKDNRPIVNLSRKYDLCKLEDRKMVVAALKGRKNSISLPLNE